MALFAVELIGLIWSTCPERDGCSLQGSPLDFWDYMFLQVAAMTGAAYSGRMMRVVMTLGCPREDAVQSQAVDEKV